MIRYISYILIAGSLVSCGKGSSTTYPSRKDLTQAVYASGKLYPLNDYKVFSKLPGYVEKVHVKVGDTVTIGQPLLTIKSEVSSLNAEAAKNQYELAQKNAGENASFMMALKQEVASARAKYELDSLNFQRYSSLIKENATTRVQFDQARTQYEVSKLNYQRASSSLNSTRERVMTELENARLQYEAQLSNRNDYVIASAVNGKVYDIVPKEGELVGNVMMLMEVGDGAAFEVELSVDETDISFLRKGQQIVYTIDAYKDHVFGGKVAEVYPRINQANKTARVVASITLDSRVEVFSGMSVEANIIIQVREGTLVIPREFLLGGDRVIRAAEGDTVVLKKGAEDLEFVEVLGGIDEQTQIRKP